MGCTISFLVQRGETHRVVEFDNQVVCGTVSITATFPDGKKFTLNDYKDSMGLETASLENGNIRFTAKMDYSSGHCAISGCPEGTHVEIEYSHINEMMENKKYVMEHYGTVKPGEEL